ncbi:MAG: TetR/AcrR family transcriptional regulator [Desulfoprunum sp.]|uniref:TetR/AcrR family transcriptional regulator n=1 Tax=Desulfoprunum sp. TaxID=2020866 RepID=UPI003C766BD1
MKDLNKRSKIIAAATKVFAKKGFFTARISDIAKEAKVADGTIYLYFNNKYDILISVFEEEIGKIIDQIRKILATETDPKKMLEMYVTRHLQTMKKNRNLAEVIQIELRQTNKLIKEYRNTKFIEYTDMMADIVRIGQSQGLFRADIEPDIAKRFFFGALDEVSRIWNTSAEGRYSVEEIAGQLLKIILSGISAPNGGLADPDGYPAHMPA